MSGPRREKVADLVRDAIARLIQSELHDARRGFVTVTAVEMSGDLRHARVFVSVLQEGPAREQALEALQAARGFIRKRLGAMLRLRYTPEIVFRLDTSIEYGSRIEDLIEKSHSREPEEPGSE